MDYNALTAWGTLAAVVVALFLGVLPIWREHRASKVMARHVRDQITTILTVMRGRCWTRLRGPDSSFLLEDADRDILAQLRTVYPHVTMLTPAEVDRIGVVYFFMNAYLINHRVERKDLQQISDSVVAADKVIVQTPDTRENRRRNVTSGQTQSKP